MIFMNNIYQVKLMIKIKENEIYLNKLKKILLIKIIIHLHFNHNVQNMLILLIYLKENILLKKIHIQIILNFPYHFLLNPLLLNLS